MQSFQSRYLWSRFRRTWYGGLVFKAHRLCVSLNSRLKVITKKKKKKLWGCGVYYPVLIQV